MLLALNKRHIQCSVTAVILFIKFVTFSQIDFSKELVLKLMCLILKKNSFYTFLANFFMRQPM
jgi:hypothetical protein